MQISAVKLFHLCIPDFASAALQRQTDLSDAKFLLNSTNKVVFGIKYYAIIIRQHKFTYVRCE